MFMTDKELELMIDNALKEAELELDDNGKELNIVCDYKNGNNLELTGYSKQIDEDNFTDEDKIRHKRLAKLCGVLIDG